VTSEQDLNRPPPLLERPFGLGRRVAWNTIAQAAARIVGLALALVTVILVTRHLGVRGYGNLTSVLVYLSLAGVFFDWGIPTLLVRRISQRTASPADAIGTAVALRFVLAVAVAALALALAFAIYNSPGDRAVRSGIAIGVPMILFTSITTTLGTFFQAELKMVWFAAAEAAGQAVTVALISVAIASGLGFYSIVGAAVVGSGANALLVFLFLSRFVRIRPSVDLSAWRALVLESLPLGVALVLSALYFRLDAILLSVLRGPHDVGIYGIGFRFSEMLTPFALYFVASVFPVLAALHRQGADNAFRLLTQRSFDVLVVAATPIVFGTMAIAPQIVRVLAGPDFAAAATPMRLVIAGTGLTFLNILLGYVVIAVNRQRSAIWVNAIALVFNFALNIALIPPYGYNAAASVATASELVILAGLLFFTRRYTGFLPGLAVAARAVVAGVLMFGVVFSFHPNLAVDVLLGAAVYVVALLVLGVHKLLELAQVLRPSPPETPPE
jgi:O-antigen/teichoic acid export membrane protein